MDGMPVISAAPPAAAGVEHTPHCAPGFGQALAGALGRLGLPAGSGEGADAAGAWVEEPPGDEPQPQAAEPQAAEPAGLSPAELGGVLAMVPSAASPDPLPDPSASPGEPVGDSPSQPTEAAAPGAPADAPPAAPVGTAVPGGGGTEPQGEHFPEMEAGTSSAPAVAAAPADAELALPDPVEGSERVHAPAPDPGAAPLPAGEEPPADAAAAQTALAGAAAAARAAGARDTPGHRPEVPADASVPRGAPADARAAEDADASRAPADDPTPLRAVDGPADAGSAASHRPGAVDAAATGAEGGEAPGASSRELVERISAALDRMAAATSPRRMVLEAGDLRLAVALQGEAVRVTVLRGEDGAWSGDLASALAARGLTLSTGTSPGTAGEGRHGRPRPEHDVPADPLRPARPSTARTARLAWHAGVRL